MSFKLTNFLSTTAQSRHMLKPLEMIQKCKIECHVKLASIKNIQFSMREQKKTPFQLKYISQKDGIQFW